MKKRILFLTSFFMMMCMYKSDYTYHPSIDIIENSDYSAFAKYSKGYVYIGDNKYLENMKKYGGEWDVFVLDERDGKNPNMKIYNSFLFQEKEERNEILEILLSYEKKYPSKWNRSIESMRLEWLAHNILYALHSNIHRTGDVDLDNADENTYQKDVYNRLLHL